MILFSLLKYFLRKIDKRPWTLQNLVDLGKHHDKEIPGPNSEPKVTIIIPTKDKANLLKSCVTSVMQITNYSNFELIVVDNASVEPDTISYLTELQAVGVKVISYRGKFNYSEICNLAASKSNGDFLCFLNNDTRVVSADWLRSMVEHARQKDVGLVGAVMTFPEGSLQHMGVALEYTGVAGHPGRHQTVEENVPKTCYQVSAVTFACAVISSEKFLKLGGLDSNFPVAFNDVDMSIRASKAGFRNVVCTRAHLCHMESQSRKRATSWGGFIRGARDVILLLKKQQSSLSENFFARRVLFDKSSKQWDAK